MGCIHCTNLKMQVASLSWLQALSLYLSLPEPGMCYLPAVVVNDGGRAVGVLSSNGTTFDVPSFYATALTSNAQNVTVAAYNRGKLYASITFTLEPGAPPLQVVLPPEFTGIDAIVFRAYNLADPNAPPSEDSTLFAVDDLVLISHAAAAQPPPPPLPPPIRPPPPPRGPSSGVAGPHGERSVCCLPPLSWMVVGQSEFKITASDCCHLQLLGGGH